MTIKDLATKYNLTKDDFWQHQQSGQWIIKHDAIEKISTMEDIELDNWVVELSERDFVRYRITMSMDDKETGGVRTVETIGEADPSNCMSKYYGMMAEKRAKDRCILKLIRAYEYGISSDVELADGKNFEKQYFPKTEVQKSDFDRLVHHSCFNGIMKEYQKKFKETNSDSEVNELRQEMIKMTKGKK